MPSAAEYNRLLAWTKPPFIFNSTPCTVELTAARGSGKAGHDLMNPSFAFESSSNATRAHQERLARGIRERLPAFPGRPTPLSYPKPPGRVPKGKVWDGASGHWVEAEAEGGEEGGDAKRAYISEGVSARGHIYM